MHRSIRFAEILRPFCATRGRGQDARPAPQLRDEEVDTVRQAFEVMGLVALDAKGGLPLIVLGHAPRDVWGDIDGVVDSPG